MHWMKIYGIFLKIMNENAYDKTRWNFHEIVINNQIFEINLLPNPARYQCAIEYDSEDDPVLAATFYVVAKCKI